MLLPLASHCTPLELRSGQRFDVTANPPERQRETAEAYRAPGYEVAAAYGIPLPWVGAKRSLICTASERQRRVAIERDAAGRLSYRAPLRPPTRRTWRRWRS